MTTCIQLTSSVWALCTSCQCLPGAPNQELAAEAPPSTLLPGLWESMRGWGPWAGAPGRSESAVPGAEVGLGAASREAFQSPDSEGLPVFST